MLLGSNNQGNMAPLALLTVSWSSNNQGHKADSPDHLFLLYSYCMFQESRNQTQTTLLHKMCLQDMVVL